MGTKQTVLSAVMFVCSLCGKGVYVDSRVLQLTTDPTPQYYGAGVSLYCHIQQPIHSISLEGPPGLNTAVYCYSATGCESNYPGYFFDKMASNLTHLVFSILRLTHRDEGVWTCRDATQARSVALNLNQRLAGCDATSTSEEPSTPVLTAKREPTTTTATAAMHAKTATQIVTTTTATTTKSPITADNVEKVTKVLTEHEAQTILSSPPTEVTSKPALMSLHDRKESSMHVQSTEVTPCTPPPCVCPAGASVQSHSFVLTGILLIVFAVL